MSRNTLCKPVLSFRGGFLYCSVFFFCCFFEKIFRLQISKYSPFIQTHFVTFTQPWDAQPFHGNTEIWHFRRNLWNCTFLQFKVSRNTEMHYAKQFCHLGVGFLFAALYIKIFRLHISKYSPFIETHFVTFLSNRGMHSLFMETLKYGTSDGTYELVFIRILGNKKVTWSDV